MIKTASAVVLGRETTTILRVRGGYVSLGWSLSEFLGGERVILPSRLPRAKFRDRVRTQSRIKAELSFFGIRLEEPRGKWTQIYFETLQSIMFGDRWMQESFNRSADKLRMGRITASARIP
jgi:hypothetical protein